MAAQQALDRQKVQQLYDAGVPIFTKDGLRDALRQLEDLWASGEAGEFSITRLDGQVVKLEAQSNPKTLPPDAHKGAFYFRIHPHLRYRPLEMLLHEGPSTPPSDPFSPIRLCNNCYTVGKPDPALSPEDMLREFGQVQSEWEASSPCQELRQILQTVDIPPVKKIVAFACSTMDWGEEPSSASRLQHCLVLTLKDILSALNGGKEVPGFAQDPIYVDADKQTLQHHGVTVLDDPRGFLEVDDTSAVFSANPDVPIRDIVLELARPPIMVWNEMKEGPQHGTNRDGYSTWCSADPITPRVRAALEQQYTKIELPQTSGREFHGLAIFVRKPAVES